jgi:mono/diheme cytochrome c family protein
MRSLTSWLAAAAVSLSFVVVAAEPSSTGDVANGKRLFMTVGCYQCHGTTGAGGGFAGPKLAPNPPPPAAVKAKLRTASGRMPVYSEAVLNDSEIVDIDAYLQSVPNGKPARDIELLNR